MKDVSEQVDPVMSATERMLMLVNGQVNVNHYRHDPTQPNLSGEKWMVYISNKVKDEGQTVFEFNEWKLAAFSEGTLLNAVKDLDNVCANCLKLHGISI